MNQNTNEVDPQIPPRDIPINVDAKDTLGWTISLLLKVGAGYLAKMIIDALGL